MWSGTQSDELSIRAGNMTVSAGPYPGKVWTKHFRGPCEGILLTNDVRTWYAEFRILEVFAFTKGPKDF
jgi:hypothetical protein